MRTDVLKAASQLVVLELVKHGMVLLRDIRGPMAVDLCKQLRGCERMCSVRWGTLMAYLCPSFLPRWSE